MTSKREHSHARANHDVSIDRDDAGVGRVSRSAQLDAPTSPVVSGLLSRKAERDANGVAAGAEQAVASAQGSSGSALPDALMRKFEQSLGADLSGVRVHTGGPSEEASHAVGAKAYTMGQDIHFGAGHYDPHSDQGQHLLAHEVAHTVQQGGSAPRRQNKLEVSTPFDAAEHEADSAAAAMVSGRPFAVTMGAGVQRKIFRDPTKDQRPQDLKNGFDIVAWKSPKATFAKYFEVEAKFSVKFSSQFLSTTPDGKGESAPLAGGVTMSTEKGVGVKAEYDLLKQETRSMGWFSESFKPKLSFECNQDGVKFGVGAEFRGSLKNHPSIKIGSDVAANAFSVKWRDLKTKGLGAVKFLTFDIGGSINGETMLGTLEPVKCTVKGDFTASVSPAWGAIIKDALKEGAEKGLTEGATVGAGGAGVGATTAGAADATATAGATGGAGATSGTAGASAAAADTAVTGATGATTAGTTGSASAAAAATDGAVVASAGVAMDVGAVAAGLAAIIIPLGVGAIMVWGASHEPDLTAARQAGQESGSKMCAKVDEFAIGYISVLTGGSGAGPGAVEANDKVAACMAATKKLREQACADLLEQAGGRDALRTALRTRMRAILFEKATASFETAFKDRMGITEKLGSLLGTTMGIREGFRDSLTNKLYHDPA